MFLYSEEVKMCLYVEKLSILPSLDSMPIFCLLQLPCTLNKTNIKFYLLTGRTWYECDRVLMKDISKKRQLKYVKVKAYNLHLLLGCFYKE